MCVPIADERPLVATAVRARQPLGGHAAPQGPTVVRVLHAALVAPAAIHMSASAAVGEPPLETPGSAGAAVRDPVLRCLGDEHCLRVAFVSGRSATRPATSAFGRRPPTSPVPGQRATQSECAGRGGQCDRRPPTRHRPRRPPRQDTTSPTPLGPAMGLPHSEHKEAARLAFPQVRPPHYCLNTVRTRRDSNPKPSVMWS